MVVVSAIGATEVGRGGMVKLYGKFIAHVAGRRGKKMVRELKKKCNSWQIYGEFRGEQVTLNVLCSAKIRHQMVCLWQSCRNL